MKRAIFFLLTLFLISCQPKWDETQLFGTWDTISWTIEESGNRISDKMEFEFHEDKTYRIDYGTEVELGKFWLETDYLVTVEEGQYEKKVKIIDLKSDTFRFRMNRGGRIENVVLVKP